MFRVPFEYTHWLAQVNTLAYVLSMAKDRLSRAAWLEAGFRALVRDGPDGLRAERLARDLGMTKGSFYWHFRDVPDFRAALLTLWQDNAFTAVVDRIEREPSPESALRVLAQMAASGAGAQYGGIEVEPAIRAWARSDPAVRAAVARIDSDRLAYLSGLLAACGEPRGSVARVLYAAAIGLETLSCLDGDDNSEAIGRLVDLILAQRSEV